MKYVILIGDGMGDYPCYELGGRTPLEAAYTPNMDILAQQGVLGLVQSIPIGMNPGSDVANLALIGYDPRKYYTGRAPIEAASYGVNLEPDDVAFRCNFVTLGHRLDKIVMEDYSAGHINTEDATSLILTLNSVLGREGLNFYPGVSYRHLVVWKEGPLNIDTIPPHEIIGQSVNYLFDNVKGLSIVNKLIQDSWPILMSHQINKERRVKGEQLVNSIWLWGQGTNINIPTLKDRYGIKGGVVISAVGLIKGLGRLVGLKVIDIFGATGLLNTNYAGKVAAVFEGLEYGDIAFLHVEAPDEASHGGNLEEKVESIEKFDKNIVGPVLEGLKRLGPHRILLACDHFTPVSLRTHTRNPVPFVLWDSDIKYQGGKGFYEVAALDTGIFIQNGDALFKKLLNIF